ncbi:MAG: hypothetical protein U0Q18_28700 [Bryobacteraceae bacterium]
MLTIRREQLDIFSKLDVENFEQWVLTHLKKFFPAQCAAQDDRRTVDMIRTGIRRAGIYRIVSKPDVCKYIDLMMVFGPDFDQDRRYPWASEILARDLPPAQRIQQLRYAARNHLSRKSPI